MIRVLRAFVVLLLVTGTACGRGRNNTVDSTTNPTAAPVATDGGSTVSPAESSAGYESAITDEVVDNPTFDDFESQITGLIKRAGLPGASLLVVQHGELIEQEAWLDYSLDTVVPIASGSKWLTAATIMTLVDEGLIALDAPISTYVAQAAGTRAGEITMRQLLSLTSGLVSDDDVPCVSDPEAELVECARTLASIPLTEAPGKVFRYGGQHMYLAGAIAELVTGVPYADLFRQRIAEPLGMDKTYFVQVDGSRYTDVTNTAPAGAAVSTLGDYGRFLEMIVHDGVLPDGTRLLSSQAIAEMQTNQITEARYGNAAPFRVADESPYGLGEWLDWTAPDGTALVLSSDGSLGFRPWIDKQNDLFGVYLVRDDGSAAVDGNPDPDADDANQVYVSGNWIYELVAEALGNPLPAVKYPDH
ncbi:MAG: beta-lactamase family protein [Actinobacteria bacterium]|nr:beta-lactamase family protein [Actinomycetota bacterium]